YHGHRVLVRLPRKTPCHSPVKKCLNPNATATLSIHSTRCIWMSRVRTYGLGAAQRAGYSENWLGPSAAHLAIPDGMDFASRHQRSRVCNSFVALQSSKSRNPWSYAVP